MPFAPPRSLPPSILAADSNDGRRVNLGLTISKSSATCGGNFSGHGEGIPDLNAVCFSKFKKRGLILEFDVFIVTKWDGGCGEGEERPPATREVSAREGRLPRVFAVAAAGGDERVSPLAERGGVEYFFPAQCEFGTGEKGRGGESFCILGNFACVVMSLFLRT